MKKTVAVNQRWKNQYQCQIPGGLTLDCVNPFDLKRAHIHIYLFIYDGACGIRC